MRILSLCAGFIINLRESSICWDRTPAPKILYEGTLSRYELDLLCILADAGCDVVCLEYEGDSSYQKLDPQNKKTQPYLPKEQFPFPQGLSIEQMIRQKQRNDRISLVYDRDKTARPRTNSWMPENWDLFRESLKEPDERRTRHRGVLQSVREDPRSMGESFLYPGLISLENAA